MADLKPGIALLAKALADAAPPAATTRAITLTIGGREAHLTFGDYLPLTGSVRHQISGAALDLPQATLDWLIAPLGVSCPTDPVQREMLLELACIDLLTMVEPALGTPQEGAHIAFGIRAQTPSGPLDLALHLCSPLADELTNHLDSIADAPDTPDPSRKVPITLRLGQQFLTKPEIAALKTGDVVMLEPGPTLLLTLGGLAASVDLNGAGATALSELMPLPAMPARDDLQVCFDAAQAELTLETLNTLESGAAIPLAVFDQSAVDVVVGGHIAGRGQPVMIGTGKGVRILHLTDAR